MHRYLCIQLCFQRVAHSDLKWCIESSRRLFLIFEKNVSIQHFEKFVGKQKED